MPLQCQCIVETTASNERQHFQNMVIKICMIRMHVYASEMTRFTPPPPPRWSNNIRTVQTVSNAISIATICKTLSFTIICKTLSFTIICKTAPIRTICTERRRAPVTTTSDHEFVVRVRVCIDIQCFMVRKTKKMAAQQFMVKQTKRVRALAPVPTDSVVREQLNCRAMPRDP